MNRTRFYLCLTVPFLLLGVAMKSIISFDTGITVLQYMILLYLPIIIVTRMKHIGMTVKEMLLTFIPFYGLKYRYKVFIKK